MPRCLLVAVLGLFAVLAVAPASAQSVSVLPASVDAAVAHVRAEASALGRVGPSEWAATSGHESAQSGLAYVYVQQRVGGIDVDRAVVSVALGAAGRVVHAAGDVVTEVPAAFRAPAPALGAAAAAAIAARSVGLSAALGVVRSGSGPDRATTLAPAAGGAPTAARLLWARPGGGSALVLAWEVTLDVPDEAHLWRVLVDAATGQTVETTDLVIHEADHAVGHEAGHEVASGPAGAPLPPLAPRVAPAAPFAALEADATRLAGSYRVFAVPVETPNHAATVFPADGRTTVANPADATASPLGWHSDGTTAYTVTRGNNAHAYVDRVAPINTPDPGTSPDGGAGLAFAPALDFAQNPATQGPAAVVNLFYWTNVFHDVLYRYGFTEAAGNYQTSNRGQGGLGNDAVLAEAQDGSGTNNANFSPGADGQAGRMQMYLWTDTSPGRDGDFSNDIVVHELGHGISHRLTGGPGSDACLQNDEQMGEGWSDFYGLMLTMDANDVRAQRRGIGTWVQGQTTTGTGIRPVPYSTSFAVNNYTYQRTRTGLPVPHGIGFVWATALWEMTWDLVDAYGFSPDFYNATGTAGNQIAMRLVTEALKLQPCSPGFVSGRDAIFAADQALYGGAHTALLWQAFARRGLGVSASQGATSSNADNTEAFDTPLASPVATVAPSSVSATAAPGATATATVTVSNTAAAGSASLTFSASIVGATAATGVADPMRAMTADGPRPTGEITRPRAAKDAEAQRDATRETGGTGTADAGGGPDGFGYTWADSNEPGGPAYAWVDIATSGTAVALGDDASADVALPFAFPFYGVGQTSVRVVSNGYLAFGGTSSDYANSALPSSVVPNNVAAPFWDDLNPTSVGSIRHRNMGDGRFVVSWIGVPPYTGTGTYTFQAILHADGKIVYQYQAMSGATTSATVGIEDAAGTAGTQVAFNTAYAAAGKAVRFTPPLVWASVAPGSGTLAPGASAPLTLTLDATTLAAGTYTATLRVATNDPARPAVNVSVTFTVAQTPTDPFVVTAPAVCDVVVRGQTTAVRWTSPAGAPPSASVRVEFVPASGAPVVVAASTPNDGVFEWTPAAALALGAGARIRLTAAGAAPGESAPFTLRDAASTFAVTAPAAGATWLVGTSNVVRWTSPTSVPASGRVRVDVLDAATCAVVAVALPRTTNDGAQGWGVPASFVPGTYRIAVTESVAGAETGRSAPFAIAPFRGITLDAPVAGTVWTAGQTQTVAWTSTGVPADATVTLNLIRTGVPTQRIARTNNDGSFAWTIPAAQAPSAAYKVYLIYTLDGAAVTVRSGAFEIAAPAPARGDALAEARPLDRGWQRVTLDDAPGAAARLAALATEGRAVVAVGPAGVLVADAAGRSDGLGALAAGTELDVWVTADAVLSQAADAAPVAAVAAPQHLIPDVIGAAGVAVLLVSATGLADGDEVAAVAPDGRVVGAGVVAGGRAAVVVRGALDDADDARSAALASGTILTLRRWSAQDGVRALDASAALRLDAAPPAAAASAADGSVPPVVYADGAVWQIGATAGASAGGALPTRLALGGASPNPVTGAATVRYEVPAATARLTLAVFDLLGRRVATLADGPAEAGHFAARWDASALASGVYVMRLSTDAGAETRRVTVVR